MIAAIGKNNELGKDNDLIWHLKEDMQFFRENTIGKPIIMGLNTFYSLPHLLKDRQHIILTHREIDEDNIFVFHDIYKLLSFIEYYKDEVMVIGGASIYSQFIEYANKMLLTEIDQEDKDADVFFPCFNEEEWNKTILKEVNENNINYNHVKYVRKLSK